MHQQKVSVGRIVYFAFEKNGGGLEERPARIVRLWSEETGCSNIVVDIDGQNDYGLISPQERAPIHERTTLAVWRTSVLPADDHEKPQANRWRWPPRV